MTFADWRKTSKLFAATQKALDSYSVISHVCRAAYKAGERDGCKRTEDVAKKAIELRELMRSKLEGP